MSKSALIFSAGIVAIMLSTGCEVRKTGEETYEVKVPEKELEAAGEEMQESAAEAGEEMREAVEEAAPVVRENVREAARATGEAMQSAGAEIEQRTGRTTPSPTPIATPRPIPSATPIPTATPQ
jgi:hypothetical protein